MADFDESSLLGDMLAAASQKASEPASGASAPRARIELEDLIRLSDRDWQAFIGAAAPDDLVVICSSIMPAWRDRVFRVLDKVSEDWIRSNIAALDDPAPAMCHESRDRLMATARRLQRDGSLTLPEPVQEPVPASPSAQVKPESPGKPSSPPPPPAAPAPMVSIGFDAGSLPPGSEKTRHSQQSNIVRIGAEHHPALPSADDDGLATLFGDLKRLRAQAGFSALAPLAEDVPDPFLRAGLALVASGLQGGDLERALDGELTRQAVAYLEHLTQARTRLIDLANPT
jgi:hypothetical protein